MFEKIRSSNVDEAVIWVLDILATVANITEPRNYIFYFETESLPFQLRTKKKASLKRSKYKTKFWLLEKVFLYGLLSSLLVLMILAAVVSKSYHKIAPPGT